MNSWFRARYGGGDVVQCSTLFTGTVSLVPSAIEHWEEKD